MSRHHSRGFTIIELTLAMAFVSLLLIAITMTTIQMANMYAKGLTLKEVNQVGMILSQDMQTSIGASSPLSTAGEDATDYKQIPAHGSSEIAGGRLCTGSASYIWNFGAYLENPVNVYETGDEVIRLVKIDDRGKLYCNDPEKRVSNAGAVEILKDGEREVALHSFSITEVAHDSALQQALYRLTFEVGTNDQLALGTTEAEAGSIATVDTSCKPPNEDGAFQDYCAVNKFEFTARAGNRGELR